MTLLARIEADLALAEKARHAKCPDEWPACSVARRQWPAYARALKVAVEGLEVGRENYIGTIGGGCGCSACVGAGNALRAIERELAGGGE